ncbi:MAG: hypothetical protein LRY67_06425 [Gammaproteobacteria bacterium]|nr:hypothetical protein [Gammaproteobacteria bacterium]MCD8525344.1 hypothetical protein [Gammaproteobacteria bacterium]MCD8543130.1 hypothetical protein [Gammaproteobacteria bacterium]MCD8573884.1 hypothetical protein [Gammaproteobacteria bacterium]
MVNPRVEKLKVALVAAKETIKSLKNDLRTLKADNKAELKAAKGGAAANPTKAKKAVKAKVVKKVAKKPEAKKIATVAKKAVKKVTSKKAPRAKKSVVASTPATDV